MTLTEALCLPEERGVTALVGGGGKTTLMFRLADEITAAGRPAALTTTTRIAVPEPGMPVVSEEATLRKLLRPGNAVCLGRPAEPGKLAYPGYAMLSLALALAGRVIAEADGAKRLPMKAPADYEPVFPVETDSVIAVAGLDAVGQRAEETCFRCDIACRVLSIAPSDRITPERLAALLVSPQGQRKGVPAHARFTVVLNKADTPERLAAGRAVAEAIRRRCPGTPVLITALHGADPVIASY